MSIVAFRARIITASLALVLSIMTLWQTWDLPMGTMRAVKTGFFPKVFGVLLLVLSIGMLYQLYLARHDRRQAAEGADSEESVNLRGLVGFSALFVIFVVLCYTAGFLIAAVVSVLGGGFLLGLRKWKLFLLAGGTALMSWLLFDQWLGISLPSGMW
ncbi:tripartite tricarboxylate transporter TctB family protein [Paenibacillus daejeonensis]|uniref:tripartite tricarboxylate transporter TctB family protein n=1 Tax=Paenibacillus daejeonensis TaxID=135193 RepID=UPI00037D687E|nr:tripartite tricarboxylate transporter TctB family protein [Paenibacillus daejeonensis]